MFTRHFPKASLVIPIVIFLCVISTSIQRALADDFRIPTSEILEIWEHSCIKHMQANNNKRAGEVLSVMNWQCANKQYFNLGSATKLKEFNSRLASARSSKQSHLKTENTKWLCNPRRSMIKLKKDFYDNIGIRIEKYLRQKGANKHIIFVVIAQVIQETAWGTRVFGNNYFNIKGEYRGESVEFMTSEELGGGTWTRTVDKFRKYPDLETSIEDYISLLEKKWPTSHNLMFKSKNDLTVKKFIDGLKAGTQGGYATDKEYSTKLYNLCEQVSVELTSSALPTYLKCLNRDEELELIMEDKT